MAWLVPLMAAYPYPAPSEQLALLPPAQTRLEVSEPFGLHTP